MMDITGDMSDEEFINTPSEWETESEEDFLKRILYVLDNDEMRSGMQTTVIRLFINERLDPEFAKYERAGLVQTPPWAKDGE